jgi:phage repressor protein C with HTH and peptisase S24 domain
MALSAGRPDLAVYASAAGGPEGAWVLSGDAIAWIHRDQRLVGVRDAFACYVVGESMFPAYEQGNLLLVNPAVPPNAGDDCLLIQEVPDGSRYALIKRLVRFNSTSWTVKQWNPDKTFSLPRKEWQRALLVIGKYNRG